MWDHSPLTAKEKKVVTNEWNEKFPMLKPCGTMELFEILGPFAIGIVLNQTGRKDVYSPFFAVVNLMRDSEGIGFTIYNELVRLSEVSRYTKPERKEKLMAQAEENLWLPLGQNLTFDFLLEKIETEMVEEKTSNILRLIVSLMCYKNYSREEVFNTCRKWTENYNVWSARQTDPLEFAMEIYRSQDECVAIVEQQIKRFKMDKCPRFEII